MPAHAIEILQPEHAALVPYDPPAEPLPADQIDLAAVVSAISPGTEIGYAFAASQPREYPCRVGYAMVSRVLAAGHQTDYLPGDLVFSMHNHQTRMRCPAKTVWRIPPGLDPAAAALARLAGVAWSTLTTTRARPPARVAVTGLGIVGNLAAQVFHAAGYEVLACDPDSARRQRIADCGIPTAAQLPAADPHWFDQVDLVVDCSGHEAAVLDACNFVRKGGEVVLVGVAWRRRTDLTAHDILHTVFHRYVHLRSGWEWEVPGERQEFRVGSIRENIAGALDWIARGRIRTAGLYKRIDPRDCEAAYRELQKPQGGALTAVYDWSLLETAR